MTARYGGDFIAFVNMYSAGGELEWSVDFHTKEGLAESNEARADSTTPCLQWAAGERMCHSPPAHMPACTVGVRGGSVTSAHVAAAPRTPGHVYSGQPVTKCAISPLSPQADSETGMGSAAEGRDTYLEVRPSHIPFFTPAAH